jgi:phage RecT family recombinase
MANEIANTNTGNKMSVTLASNGVKALGETLHLTQKQLITANAECIALASNPNMKNVTAASIVKFVYSKVRYGFNRDDACYPVPYGNEVQAQIGYQGWKELAMRTGKYSKIECKEIVEGEEPTTDEDGEPVINFSKDFAGRKNKKVIGYYGYAKYKDGSFARKIYWTIDEVEKHAKKYSQTYRKGYGLWATDFDKMARKTIIKFVCKDLDMSDDLKTALTMDQAVFTSANTGKPTYTYADNPNNVSEVFDVSDEQPTEKKSTVKNNILPKKEEAKPTQEETDPYDFVADLTEEQR